MFAVSAPRARLFSFAIVLIPLLFPKLLAGRGFGGEALYALLTNIVLT
jgi:hypothetical protein